MENVEWNGIHTVMEFLKNEEENKQFLGNDIGAWETDKSSFLRVFMKQKRFKVF